ncbi:hypothetical protein [Curtobacterium aetherium]|uniref:Uncharacterized protein n=1 Tax=Curtobacterium aetherium TaxID=2841594 RepID=A0ACD1E7M3_9MICO|nr:hypothetical protein [Curtobacterium sp. L6-1]QWS34962.1 hypothetical protein KM842_07530 [Curtobacterium sp. L6-1]
MHHEPRRIAHAAHWWVDRAADLSPVAVRETRREQWHADVAGAAEVGVPRRGLVLGMVLTAAVHRSVRHVPGGPVTSNHTARICSARVLIAAAVLSVVASSVLQRTLFFVWTSTQQARVGEVLQLALGFVVPVALVLVALSRVTDGRRWVAAAALAVAGSVLLGVGAVFGGVVGVVCASTGSAGLLAAWFSANRSRPRVWSLVAMPAAALVTVDVIVVALRSVVDASPAARPVLWEAEGLVVLALPILVAAVVAVALPILDGRSAGRAVTA